MPLRTKNHIAFPLCVDVCASQRLDIEDEDATWSEKQYFFKCKLTKLQAFFSITIPLNIHTGSFPVQAQFHTLSKTAGAGVNRCDILYYLLYINLIGKQKQQ